MKNPRPRLDLPKKREVWSSGLSAFGFVLAIPCVILLIIPAASEGKPWHVASFIIYGLGLISVFGTSTLYHGYRGREKVRFVFHQMDYMAIPIMIAGGFTPFCLIAIRTTLGAAVLVSVWAAAGIVIAIKAWRPQTPKWVYVTICLFMGWSGLLLVPSMARAIGWAGVGIAAFGGLLFSVGTVIFNRKGSRPVIGNFGFHDIWHIFILAGTAVHYYVLYRFLLPL